MKNLIIKNPSELSFTIFETIVAVGLLMAFTLEMAGGQGSVINKVEYARHSNDAIWLAKRIMAQVEYNYQTHDLKELDLINPLKDQSFKIDGDSALEYTYTVDVREWKFPLFDFLLKGGSTDDDKDKDENKSADPNKSAPGGIPGIESIIELIFKGHVMKVANVVVSWPEGARRDSIGLTYLLTNNKALDEYLLTKKGIWEQVIKKMSGAPLVAPSPGLWPSDPPNSLVKDGYVLFPDQSKRFPDGTRVSAEGLPLDPVQVPPANAKPSGPPAPAGNTPDPSSPGPSDPNSGESPPPN